MVTFVLFLGGEEIICPKLQVITICTSSQIINHHLSDHYSHKRDFVMKYTLTINHVTSFFSKLLNNAAFHTSLLACALEVVMATYVGKLFLVFLPFTLLQQLIVLSKTFFNFSL